MVLVWQAFFAFTIQGAPFKIFLAAYGINIILGGIIDILFCFNTVHRKKSIVAIKYLAGVSNIIIGSIFCLNKEIEAFVVAALFSLWVILRNIARLANVEPINRKSSGIYFISKVIQLASVLLGYSLLINPFVDGATIAYYTGMLMLLSGINSVTAGATVLAFHKKKFL